MKKGEYQMKASRQVLRANRQKTAFAQTRGIKAPRAERRKVAKGLTKTLTIIERD